MTEIVEIKNVTESGVWHFPKEFLRYAYMSVSNDRKRYFVKTLGMGSKIEVSEETYNNIIPVLASISTDGHE